MSTAVIFLWWGFVHHTLQLGIHAFPIRQIETQQKVRSPLNSHKSSRPTINSPSNHWNAVVTKKVQILWFNPEDPFANFKDQDYYDNMGIDTTWYQDAIINRLSMTCSSFRWPKSGHTYTSVQNLRWKTMRASLGVSKLEERTSCWDESSRNYYLAGYTV